MNIFYLDNHTHRCAKQHCDKHVVKMIIEYAQLLSTAHRVIDGIEYTDLSKNGRKIKRWKMVKNSNMEETLYKPQWSITRVQSGSDKVLDIINGCIVSSCGYVLSIPIVMVRYILRKDYLETYLDILQRD